MKKGLFFILFLVSFSARAAIIDVTTNLDENDGCGVGHCSLREAVADANLNADADTINLPSNLGVYQVTQGAIVVTKSVSIKGDAINKSIIDGSNNKDASGSFGLFGFVNLPGESAKAFGLEDLVIKNFGRPSPAASLIDESVLSYTHVNGAASVSFDIVNSRFEANSRYVLSIDNPDDFEPQNLLVNINGSQFVSNLSLEGDSSTSITGATTTINNCLFDGNRGYNGGALSVMNGFLNIAETIFYRNRADNTSGALSLTNNQVVTLEQVLFYKNSADLNGGAVASTTAKSLLMDQVSFVENTAPQASALSLSGDNTNADIINASFINNTVLSSAYLGGALNITGINSHYSLNFITITGNKRIDPAISNGTVTGGISLTGVGDTELVIKNSIVSDNLIVNSGVEVEDNYGGSKILKSHGSNILAGDVSVTHVTGASDLIDADPQFGALSVIPELGYPLTYSLTATSPAVDGAQDCLTTPLFTQTGVLDVTKDVGLNDRPFGRGCDIGTMELVCTPNIFYLDADGDGFGAGSAVQTCKPALSGYASNNTDCDDGDVTNEGLICNPPVPVSFCGDGIKADAEECDDGNDDNSDLCSSECLVIPPFVGGEPVEICGDGIIADSEECDDGNLADGDDCSSSCTLGTDEGAFGDDGVDTGGDVPVDAGNKSSGGGGCSLNNTRSSTSSISFVMLMLVWLVAISQKRKIID